MNYYIKNEKNQVFAGYGMTTGKPLWFTIRESTQVVLFTTKQAALDEKENLQDWPDATQHTYWVEKV